MTKDGHKVRSPLRGVLDVVSTVAIALTCGVLIWKSFGQKGVSGPPPRQSQAAIPAQPVSLQGAARKGAATAKVGILEFSEFQCPYCAKFTAETLPWLTSNYVDTGKVVLAFRHLPLERLHPLAFGAAEISACAPSSANFWSTHDAFFGEPKVSSMDEYEKRASASGLHASLLAKCRSDGAAAQQVRSDLALAQRLNIKSTPTFLVGKLTADLVVVTSVLQGARPRDDFDRAIRQALSAADTVSSK